MTGVLQDLRFAFRTLLHNPLFAMTAVFALTLGLGASVVMFSVIDAVMLRPLPYPQPQRLMLVIDSNPGKGFPRFAVSPANFLDYQREAKSFSSMAALTGRTFALTGKGTAERIDGLAATPELFPTLGVTPAIGRAFTREEVTAQSRLAVISYGLWQSRFGGSQDVLRETLRLDGEPYTILGVLPREFRFRRADIWVAMGFRADVNTQRGAHYLTVMGRLADGATPEQASAELRGIGDRLAASYPNTNTGWSAFADPWQQAQLRTIKPAMLVLLVAVALLVLIACANVANLLLSRATAREREVAVRAALGASNWRLVRQLLTESLTLSMIGGGLALLLASIAVNAVRRFGPTDIPRLAQAGLDARVILFAAAAVTITAVLFGSMPAIRLARAGIQGGLHSGSRTTGGHGQRLQPRSVLVTAELALSLMLLLGAGLLVRSFTRLVRLSPGFETQNLLTFSISLPEKRYPNTASLNAFYDNLFEKLRATPGVTAVATNNRLPLYGNDYSSSVTFPGGRQFGPGEAPSVELRVTSRDYFNTVGIPLRRGRLFGTNDRQGSPIVFLISETAAKELWPGEDPIGKRVKPGATPGVEQLEGEVVGIVGDVKDFGVDAEVPPMLYALNDQAGVADISVILRTSGTPEALAQTVRREVQALDPDLPVADIATMEHILAESLARRRFYMALLSAFAAVALLLATIGIFGVLSYTVMRRTREFGVRMALGASRRDVLGMVLREAVVLVGAGIGGGVVLAFVLLRFIGKLVVGISVYDPLTYGAAILCTAGLALLACHLPARRATRVDPMVALRYE